MPTYIVLGNFTDQGIRNVKDTLKRATAFKDAAKKFGASVKSLYWTLGVYDVVTVVDAPDDESPLSNEPIWSFVAPRSRKRPIA